MTPVTPVFQQQLLNFLPSKFVIDVAIDVTHKITHLNVSCNTNMDQAKANRQSVSNYFYRIFGVALNSEHGKAIVKKFSS